MSSTPSEQHQNMINAITSTLNPIYEADSSEELKQWIPQIVRMCQQMTAEDPHLTGFVRAVHETAVKAGLADWAASDGAEKLADQGWTQLAGALEMAYPELD